MKISRKSSLVDVVALVGDALRRAGIQATLTGGACANLYSGGVVQSFDADFVLAGSHSVKDLDRVLARLGFVRRRNRYGHPAVPFFVEFPPGPLGIGDDFHIRPTLRRRGATRFLMLSATDACRDRLAAFYHWSDRQSLAAAVQIALRQKVSIPRIRAWSRGEGRSEEYAQFLTEIRRTKAARRHRSARHSAGQK